MQVSFQDWTNERSLPSLGTNAGADELAFQGWRHFKESFAPEIVERAIQDMKANVEVCLDPFGGSGTTALACQFLGIHPITIEVNPYLADLIEAKLASYDVDRLADDVGKLFKIANSTSLDFRRICGSLPATFVEPGLTGRFIFSRAVADRLAALVYSIGAIKSKKHKCLFRAILGSVAVPVSNVVVNGKGRRYRRNWRDRNIEPAQVDELFSEKLSCAIRDIRSFGSRANLSYDVLRGDCRKLIGKLKQIDLAVFSPPYPNSFDYTDVYNVELWILRYLNGSDANRHLRNSTLSSHVQIRRTFAKAPKGSKLLDQTCANLLCKREKLWDKNIPEMVGGYFADMIDVVRGIGVNLSPGGRIAMVVGDSRYAGVHISSAQIICELSENLGLTIVSNEPFRSMRASPQQGGRPELSESLLIIEP